MAPFHSLLRLGSWLDPQVVLGPMSHASEFSLHRHLGNLSPWFPAPGVDVLPGEPPACSVSKAYLVHRHGSRHPISDELPIIEGLSEFVQANSATFSHPREHLPSEFAFLVDGWTSTFTLDDLTPIGRQQLFDHGVKLRLQYPDLYTTELLAGGQDRVVESAQWFALGYFGRDANKTTTLEVIGENRDTLSFITPAYKCDAWTYSSGTALRKQWGDVYLPPIAARINRLLATAYPGIRLSKENIHGALYACAYGTAVDGPGKSPWCEVFTPEEILWNEYEYDLLMRGSFGYGLPRKGMGSILGSLLISNLTEFMQLDSRQTLSLNFGHDTTVALTLTALGLSYDEHYAASGPPQADRKWRTAHQEPFAAQMLFKLLECGGSSGKRIQLSLNDANVDLQSSGCSSDAYGSCSFDDFLSSERVQAALRIEYNGTEWQSVCSTS